MTFPISACRAGWERGQVGAPGPWFGAPPTGVAVKCPRQGFRCGERVDG